MDHVYDHRVRRRVYGSLQPTTTSNIIRFRGPDVCLFGSYIQQSLACRSAALTSTDCKTELDLTSIRQSPFLSSSAFHPRGGAGTLIC